MVTVDAPATWLMVAMVVVGLLDVWFSRSHRETTLDDVDPTTCFYVCGGTVSSYSTTECNCEPSPDDEDTGG